MLIIHTYLIVNIHISVHAYISLYGFYLLAQQIYISKSVRKSSKSIAQSPSSVPGSCSAGYKILYFLCNLKVNFLHKPWRCVGTEGIAPVIFSLDTKWKWLVSFTLQPLKKLISLRYSV